MHIIYSFIHLKLFSHSFTHWFVCSFIYPSISSFIHSLIHAMFYDRRVFGWFWYAFRIQHLPLSLSPTRDLGAKNRIPIDLPMDIPRCWLWSPRFRHVAPLRPGEMLEPRAAERHGWQRLYGPDLLGGLSDGAGRGGSTLGGDWKSRDIQYLTSAPMIMPVYIYYIYFWICI